MFYFETASMDAAFHFSAEEYLMRKLKAAESAIMIWQTDNCVMLGRNQTAGAEINLNYASENGIKVVRRSSGGGTIFTDQGTFLYTVILPYTREQRALQTAREKVAAPVAEALCRMGVPAALEGRNDILVCGKKVSGFAQYARYGKLCTHGSLLYDADLEMLAHVLQVDEEKISSKALRSVRGRVTNIKEHMNPGLSVQDFLGALKRELFKGQEIRQYQYIPAESEIKEIETIRLEKYAADKWTFGTSPQFTFRKGKRFQGGKVEIFLDIAEGMIKSCVIQGDFLGILPLRELEERLENKEFRYGALLQALEGIELQPYLGSITRDELMACIFEKGKETEK